jgi:glycosyltransferase involved in cell wall biosynthesis
VSTGPRVGVAVGWYDPEDPTVWSGVPRAVVDQIRRLGIYAGHRNAMPPVPVARTVRWLLRQRGNLDDGWVLRRPMRLVSDVTFASRRACIPRSVDGWIQPVGSFGRLVRGRVVTLFEIAPTQLLAHPEWWASFGYPGATCEGMAWVARQQLAAHRSSVACCAASRWAADGLAANGIDPGKIHVVGYGANVRIDPPPTRDWTRPRFLFVGRDWDRKNGALVLRVFRQVRDQHPHATLDVVGGHPDLRSVPGVTGHGLVPLYGGGPDALSQRLFNSATCFVAPSWLEPFGIAYVEAAAAGVASIGTSIGGTATSIGEAGFRVEPGNESELARAMLAMCEPQVAATLGAAALQQSHRMTWDKFGERLLRALGLGDRCVLAPFLT